MEIVEGVYRVDEASRNIAHSNVYLVINRKELIVVDTGTAGERKLFSLLTEIFYRCVREGILTITSVI
jgi:hypothetical protein